MTVKHLKIIRNTARVFGAFLLFVVLLFLFGEGFPNPASLSAKELLLFLAFIIMGTGLAVSFKRELLGGILTVAGYIFFAIVNKTVFAGPVFPLFFVVGLLFIFCWWESERLT